MFFRLAQSVWEVGFADADPLFKGGYLYASDGVELLHYPFEPGPAGPDGVIVRVVPQVGEAWTGMFAFGDRGAL